MTQQRKKTIFYFDDDVECTQDLVNIINESSEYEVIRAAHRAVIEVKRDVPFDLVIIDLMIHHCSLNENGQEVENISYEDIPWQRTGVEFLKKIRNGEYVKFGFSKNVPVIIASAVVDHEAKQDIQNLTISSYIEKPFTIEDIRQAIQEVIGG